MRGEVRLWSREAVGDRGARSAQGRARLQIRGSSRGGAHFEHVVHARDAGGVEAQRLVERLRGLPRVERRAYAWGEVSGAAGAAGGRGASSVQKRARLQIRAVPCPWNICFMLVTLEVSKLSGWLNADAPCRGIKGGHTVWDSGQGTGTLNMIVIVKCVRRTQRAGGGPTAEVEGTRLPWSAPGTCIACP